MLLDSHLIAQATRVFPFSRKDGLYFADAEIVVRSQGAILGASSLAFGRGLATAKCQSELLERWAHFEWELDGSHVLAGEGMWSGDPYPDSIVVAADPAAPRRDASGYCAGPVARAADVLRHGLLEVLERDCVVRIFDHRDPSLWVERVDVAAPLGSLLHRQRALAEVFVVDRAPLPPTAIAVLADREQRSGAIGSACRMTATEAATAAVLEGVMMLTTVRHQQRGGEELPQFRGILWASRNIDRLRAELRELLVEERSGAMEADADPVRAAAGLFGQEPVAVRLPLSRASFPELGVWRVAVPGAFGPLNAERDPWPIG